jgi:hypothetical protein
MAAGGSLRIEASKRPHAESLQDHLEAYAPQLIQVGGSWQVEIPYQAETRPLLDLIGTLGRWLEDQQLASLTLHFDDHGYTLLRPTDGQSAAVGEAALRQQVAHLETALESRAVIEQAKGVLSERLAIGREEAFGLLRTAARSNRTELHALARRVLEEPQTPAEIDHPQEHFP